MPPTHRCCRPPTSSWVSPTICGSRSVAAGVIFAVAGVSLVATLSGASELRVASRDVHVADVAMVRGPGSESIGQVVIARLPEAALKTVSRRELAALIERAVPEVRVAGDLHGEVAISSTASRAPRAGPRPYVAEVPLVERGQNMTLTSAAGAVVIQRPVVALQNATAKDERLFVRTAD